MKNTIIRNLIIIAITLLSFFIVNNSNCVLAAAASHSGGSGGGTGDGLIGGPTGTFNPETWKPSSQTDATGATQIQNIGNSIIGFIQAVGSVLSVAVLAILGINLGGLVAGLGIGGVIVTLAAQDTAKNIFGGMVIFLDRTFNVGDWIQTPNYEGIVEGITFRTTRIRNFENSVVNIPNSTMADSAIINWSKMEKRRYKLRLPFSFEITSKQMKLLTDKIREMLENNPEVINEDILINFDTISTNGLSLLIDMFVKPTSYEDYTKIKNNVNEKILDIVHNLGIKLAYPTTTVFIGNEDNR